MQSRVDRLMAVTDELAETFYKKGQFREAAQQYTRTANALGKASQQDDIAWPLRVKAIMSHLRRSDARAARQAIAQEIVCYLRPSSAYQEFEVQLVEGWYFVIDRRYTEAEDRARALLMAPAISGEQTGRVYVLLSHIKWLQHEDGLAQELYDHAGTLLRKFADRQAMLDHLLFNSYFLSWPNRVAVTWAHGLPRAIAAGRLHDAITLFRYTIQPTSR